MLLIGADALSSEMGVAAATVTVVSGHEAATLGVEGHRDVVERHKKRHDESDSQQRRRHRHRHRRRRRQWWRRRAGGGGGKG